MGIRERIWPKPAFLVITGLVVAGAGLWIGRTLPTDTATPQVLQGTVSIVGGDGDEFAVALDGSQKGAGPSFGLGSVPWKDSDNAWHFAGPIDCLKPLTQGQHVRFGVVHVKDPAFGTDPVAWVDCSNREH